MLGTRYFRGSGTSEATAITSGLVALVLQKYPSFTPDQVKAFLIQNGQALPKDPGQNQLMVEANMAGSLKASSPSPAPQPLTATGTGTLEGSRGTDHLTRNGVALQGEQDIFGAPFNATATAALEAKTAAWFRRDLERQHMERQHLVRQHVGGQYLDGQHVGGQHLVREHLVRQYLEWQRLDRQYVDRQLIQRQHLVGNTWSSSVWQGHTWR